ncbi:MAG: tetratricopeptide repeat protein, partial [Nitrospirota bacterium]
MAVRVSSGTLALMACLLMLPLRGWAQDRQVFLDRASRLNQQAIEWYKKGLYTQAIPLAREAVNLFEVARGPDHPDVATSLNNLAELLQTTGDLTEARPVYERALKIRERALGPDHP